MEDREKVPAFRPALAPSTLAEEASLKSEAAPAGSPRISISSPADAHLPCTSSRNVRRPLSHSSSSDRSNLTRRVPA